MTTRIPISVDELPRFILDTVPAFIESPEFTRLDPELRTVPGLVVGQLAILLRRLHTETMSNASQPEATPDALKQILSTVEALASSPNPDIQNVIIVDLLEHLHLAADALEKLIERVGPRTRALYEAWVDPGPRSA